MITPFSETALQRQQLVEAYQQLPALSKTIIQLFSVIYEPANPVTILNCLTLMKVVDRHGKPLRATILKSRIDSLLKAGLLTQDSGRWPICPDLLVEIATRDAIQAGSFDAMVQAIEKCLPVGGRIRKTRPRYFSSERQFLREVRIGLYRHDLTFIEEQFQDYYRYGYVTHPLTLSEVWLQVCNNPFEPAWFSTLPQRIYEPALYSILMHGLRNLSPAVVPLALLQAEFAEAGEHRSDRLRIILTEQLLLRGQLSAAKQCIEAFDPGATGLRAHLNGWIACVQGDYGTAIEQYTASLTAARKNTGRRKLFFEDLGGLFFVLALIQVGTPQRLQEAQAYATIISQSSGHPLAEIYQMLIRLIKLQQGDVTERDRILSTPVLPHDAGDSLTTLMLSLAIYWVDAEVAKKRLPQLLIPFYEAAEQAGYRWLALEAAALLARLQPRSDYGQKAAALNTAGFVPLVELIQPRAAWEICLDALAHLQEPPQLAASVTAEKRLVWFITFSRWHCVLEPREQKLGKSGGWSKGRPVALKRLIESPEDFDCLTPQDHQVLRHTSVDYSYGSYGHKSYAFNDRAITALIGHPLVFWADTPTIRVEIVKGEPELLVKRQEDGWLSLEFTPSLPDERTVLVIKETPTRLKVLEIGVDHRRIAEIIGPQNQLRVPEAAAERVLAAISAVSQVVTVHSDIGGEVASAVEVPAQPIPHVHLLPAGDGLKVEVLSRPFGEVGPYYSPGGGGATVIAEIEGQRLQTTRDLEQEQALAQSVVEDCGRLDETTADGWEWLIEDPEACLELLLDLQTLGDRTVLEWPEGEKLRVSSPIDFDRLQLNIQRQRDWFAASGELQIDETHVLDMQRLLELLEQSPSRFVPLGDGQFLALTQAFRKRLDEFRSLSEKHGKGSRFHPLAALALEEFVEEAGKVKADKHWKAHLKRLRAAQDFQPELPSTLQAELRDYQLEGFRWMARLAHWGVGACLADDMGLGKTLQALALILTRAPAGPTLAIAPTSVCMNWLSEAARFAPTLNPLTFGSGDRQQLLDQLQPFDLVVCSYGLLQQEEVAEMLAGVEWQTIVLDEAQAIKNMATKRSQAAMKLKAGFKLITTGTPIENHLGELWNLFRFINPGLLGSLDSFNQRFANPIERYQDKQARNALRKLVQPFLLRRTKQQVLEELPSRTEVVLHVELSKAEMAFYEALRRDAIAKLTETDATAGHKHLQVLAEIMKLRRACCNARLVAPDTPLPSAKLEVFSEVLQELLENRHKALVFSQFVDHLQILRDHLDQQNITYQYLDGSTPAKERKKRVDAFQAGEGDVFLISLKAGGTGLNLTAADYVIHMDPWWNPAVEDQASDRAHRIGQQRPVTIYRLVSKGTIEEKIVDLHQQKRDLADSLLEGADVSGKISTEELLRLMTEG